MTAGSPRSPTPPHLGDTGVPQAGLAQCQREAEEVTELMKQNFAKALEREGRLSDLDNRAQELRAMVGTGTWGHMARGGDLAFGGALWGHYRDI